MNVGLGTRLPLLRALHGGRWLRLASQVPLLVGVACLVVFFVSFPVKGPADGLLFYTRANFEWYATGERGADGVNALVVDSFPIAPQAEIEDDVTYTPSLQEVELHVTSDIGAYSGMFASVDQLLQRESQPVALIDRDTANALGVDVGDEIGMLVFGFASTNEPISVAIGARTAPYPWIDGQGHGLLIVPTEVFPRQVLTELEASQDMFPSERRTYSVGSQHGPAPKDVVSRSSLQMAFISAFLSGAFLPGYLAVLTVATLLWGAVIARVGSHADRSNARRRAILNALGSSRRDVVLVSVAGDLVIIFIVSLAAFEVVRELAYGALIKAELAGLSGVPAAGVLALPVAVTSLARTRRLRRQMATAAVAKSLAATGGDR